MNITSYNTFCKDRSSNISAISFQRIYTQVVADYGFAAALLLSRLYSARSPLSLSSSRLSSIFSSYYCPRSFQRLSTRLISLGLLSRSLSRSRSGHCVRTTALYSLTPSGRSYMSSIYHSHVDIPLSTLRTFSMHFEHAYAFTLLRSSIRSNSFCLSISQLSSRLSLSVQCVRTFLDKCLSIGQLSCSERSRGTVPFYFFNNVILSSPPSSSCTNTSISNISYEYNGDAHASKEPESLCLRQDCSNRMNIRDVFKDFPYSKSLCRVVNALKRRFSDNKIGISKTLWHNVICLGKSQAESKNYSVEMYLRAICASIQRTSSRAKTVDLKDVFAILRAASIAPDAIDYALSDMRPYQNGPNDDRDHVNRQLLVQMSRRDICTLSFECLREVFSSKHMSIIDKICIMDAHSMQRAALKPRRVEIVQRLRLAINQKKTVDINEIYVLSGKDASMTKEICYHARYRHLVRNEIVQVQTVALLAPVEQQATALPKEYVYNPYFSQEAQDIIDEEESFSKREERIVSQRQTLSSVTSLLSSLQSVGFKKEEPNVLSVEEEDEFADEPMWRREMLRAQKRNS